MIMCVRWFDVFTFAALGLLLLTIGPQSAEADDKGLGVESKVYFAAAAPADAAAKQSKADESRAKLDAKLNPWPNQNGFISPTLDGTWRFRFALNGWLPLVAKVTLHDKVQSGSTHLYTHWILNHLDLYMPIDLEVRKGSFGAYWHTLGFKLSGDARVGRGKINWNDSGFLMDVGLSYELGRWALGEGPNAPKLTVEPIVGARLLYMPIEIKLDRLGDKDVADFSNYVPMIGLRTFWDLTEHWNLFIQADYGGFGVDDNRQTWQGVALVGYRWRGLGVGWNIQVGYRAIRMFDLEKKHVDVKLDANGPDTVISIHF